MGKEGCDLMIFVRRFGVGKGRGISKRWVGGCGWLSSRDFD
jgi:hypothetical protein